MDLLADSLISASIASEKLGVTVADTVSDTLLQVSFRNLMRNHKLGLNCFVT